MSRLIVSLCCLLLVVSSVLCQEQISREIPLQHANAVEIADAFSGQPSPASAAQDFDDFVQHCLGASFVDFPDNAWNWQSYLETQSELRARPGEWSGGIGKLLPEGLAEPPVAVTERNALRVKGTSEALAKLGEIVDLLDKPQQQVALQIACLGFTGEPLDKLTGVSWSTPAAEGKDRPEGLRFSSGDFTELLQQRRAAAACLETSPCVRNNRVIELRVAEVLPHVVVEKQGAEPTARGHCRALRLTIQPRVNADKSVTVLAEGELVVCTRGTAEALGESVIRKALKGQFRVATGQTLLLNVITDWGKEPDLWPEHEQFGAQRLQQPVIAITPRLAEPEMPYTPDPGPLTGDTNTNLLNAFFGKAVREGADGVMLGMDDQGRCVIWYRTAPDRWEPACLMPSYMLRPLLHSLGDPAGQGDKYKYSEPGGAELDITVERTTIQGRPGLVLTWPKP